MAASFLLSVRCRAMVTMGCVVPLTVSCSVGSLLPHLESKASQALISESLIFSEHDKSVPKVQSNSPGYATAVWLAS